MTWKDLTITPGVEAGILGISFLCTYGIAQRYPTGLLASAVVFYSFVLLWTMVVLKLLRVFWPIPEGILSEQKHPTAFYVWKLWSVLAFTNLSLFYVNGLLPPPLKKPFYQLLGTKCGKGIISIAGSIWEPYLVSIEQEAMIGLEALLLPHSMVRLTEDFVILGRIEIKRGAIIGVRATVGPGCIIGEYSIVNALSGVAPYTKIPAYEVWGGVPAKKVGELPKPMEAGDGAPAVPTVGALSNR
jgi:hypothetical protein